MNYGSSFSEGVSGLPDSVSGGGPGGGGGIGCCSGWGCVGTIVALAIVITFVCYCVTQPEIFIPATTNNSVHTTTNSAHTTTDAGQSGGASAPTTSREEQDSTVEAVPDTSEDAVQSNPSAQQEPPADLAEKLPYIGMPEAWISATWLGTPDTLQRSNVRDDNGISITQTAYRWKSKNGRDDTVFTAYVMRGEVIRVNKGYSASGYWPELWGMPDLYAQDPFANAPAVDSRPDDPSDYDSPEEYADDVSDWYAEHGYEDPWSAAYEYWEDNA